MESLPGELGENEGDAAYGLLIPIIGEVLLLLEESCAEEGIAHGEYRGLAPGEKPKYEVSTRKPLSAIDTYQAKKARG